MDIEFFPISSESESRYDRLNLIDWWEQSKIKNSNFLVFGAGALGNEVLKNLALFGVGKVTIVDFDTVSISNLTRSVLFRESDVGLPKVEVARKYALEINPDLIINTVNGNLEFALGVADVSKFDIILGCVDSTNSRWNINQLAYRARVPWINGGIGVSEGEISFFDPLSQKACYSCGVSDGMWQKREKRFSCSGLKRNIPEGKTPTTSTIASIVGAFQVHQALMYLHEKQNLLNPGEKIFLSLNPWISFKVEIQHQSNCTIHDLVVEPTLCIRYKENDKVKEYLEYLDESGFQEPRIKLRNEIISYINCIECGFHEKSNKLVRDFSEFELVCPKCNCETRDFEITRSISIQDCYAKNLIFQNLNLANNEVLHCETSFKKIAIQFYKSKE